jgi:hypothetical protein
MAYGSNSLGQENALGYPFPKWHPYYGWGYPAQQPRHLQQSPAIGDPNIRPGNWFGRPVVGALSTSRENVAAVQVGAGLLVGGAAYLATKSVISALLGGGAAALLVTLLPIWQDAPTAAESGRHL